MKKIIAIVLAVVMIAAMSVTVFAADKVLAKDDNSSTSDVVPVTYTSAKGYEVSIPEKFELVDANATGVATGEGIVTINKAKLNNNETLTVTVASQNNNKDMVDGYNWKLVDTAGADDIGYKIAVSENTQVPENGSATNYNNGNIATDDLAQGNAVISYTSSAITWSARSSKMVLTTAYSNQAGNFSDNLTFTATVA